jgi:hypothetical protein
MAEQQHMQKIHIQNGEEWHFINKYIIYDIGIWHVW